MGDGLARQEADTSVVAALGQVVTHFQSIFFPAEFACRACREVIRKGQENLCAESLEQRPPGIARQSRFERADALGGDDRNALRLPRETEELFIPGRLILSDRSKVMIFVTQKEDLSKVAIRIGFDSRNSIENGSLKVELHHDSEGLGESWVHGYREI